METRVRKIELENMDLEQVDNLSNQLGEKLREIVDKACEEANRISEIYGLQVKMQFLVEPLDTSKETKGT